MPIIKSTKAWVVKGTTGFDDLVFKPEYPLPEVGEHDVLVKFHAAALNFRDLAIVQVDMKSDDPKTIQRD